MTQIVANPLYAVIDACQAFDLVVKIKEQSGKEARMLFQGAATTHVEVEEIAPYVCAIDSEDVLRNDWFTRFGSNAGILFVSESPMAVIHKHLRGLFISKDITGQEYFFRFYDPRVLRGFLPACNPQELLQIFGPIQSILVEDVNPQQLIIFTQQDGALFSRKLAVSDLISNLDYSKRSKN
jgi:hypothetical protein